MANLKYYDSGLESWETLVIGKQGPAGPAGAAGPGVVSSATAPIDTSVIWYNNENGNAYTYYDGFWTSLTGPGLPAGGATGQVLAKSSSTDYATQWVALGSSRILQIVSVTKSDTFSVASTSMTNITGLSASITPSSSSSKVLARLDFGSIDGSDIVIAGDLTRGGTAIGIGDTAGSRTRSGWNVTPKTGTSNHSAAWSFLDSPATTSSTTYQARVRSNAGTAYINRSGSYETDSSVYARSISTITLMEVAG